MKHIFLINVLSFSYLVNFIFCDENCPSYAQVSIKMKELYDGGKSPKCIAEHNLGSFYFSDDMELAKDLMFKWKNILEKLPAEERENMETCFCSAHTLAHDELNLGKACRHNLAQELYQILGAIGFEVMPACG